MRTLVDIPASELEALNALSKAEGISRAESIRRAIRAYVEQKAPMPHLEDGFGLWKDKGIGTDEYLRKIRAEWDREWDGTGDDLEELVPEAATTEGGR